MTHRQGTAAFALPLMVLALGHMISNLLRTMPAIAADMMAPGIGVTAEGLAGLTGAYHFAFAAGQIPLGVALDRFGVRPVSLALLLTTAVGAVLAALAGGAAGFLIAQVVLGLGCCGMLLCPITLAAKTLTPARFGLWSGLIQGTGNIGMLLSASPMAWLVEHHGWHAGFWLSAAMALGVALLVRALVPPPGPASDTPPPSLPAEAREVVRLGLSPLLRGMMVLAFVSFAALIGLRGLWGGPWLMEVKGLPRMEAGNLLLLLTVLLILGPPLGGVLDRLLPGRRRPMLALGHLLAALCLLGIALGGPGGGLAAALGLPVLPSSYDAAFFVLFGLAMVPHPLIFAMTRAVVPPEQAGKALSAINLSFFLGAAVLQAASGPVAAWGGVAAALAFLAGCVGAAALLFLAFTRPRPGGPRRG